MELQLYRDILRRRWPIVVAVPLLTLALSLAVALARPADYGTQFRMLATRGVSDPANKAGLTAGGEDQAASELPAVLSGRPLATDIAAELARRGKPWDAANVQRAVHGSNDGHVVNIGITTADPSDGPLIAQIIVDLLKKNGLIYWGDPNATVAKPGLNISVLDPIPAQGTRLNGANVIAREVGLRTLVGLLAGTGLAFILYYIGEGRHATDAEPSVEQRHQVSRTKNQSPPLAAGARRAARGSADAAASIAPASKRSD